MNRIVAFLTLTIPSVAHAHAGHEHLSNALAHHAIEGGLVALFVGAAGYAAYRVTRSKQTNG
jgi:hypothetical protein